MQYLATAVTSSQSLGMRSSSSLASSVTSPPPSFSQALYTSSTTILLLALTACRKMDFIDFSSSWLRSLQPSMARKTPLASSPNFASWRNALPYARKSSARSSLLSVMSSPQLANMVAISAVPAPSPPTASHSPKITSPLFMSWTARAWPSPMLDSSTGSLLWSPNSESVVVFFFCLGLDLAMGERTSPPRPRMSSSVCAVLRAGAIFWLSQVRRLRAFSLSWKFSLLSSPVLLTRAMLASLWRAMRP
mmetsp:Transcript_7836/g.14191  ORF Transcript_7836/g.14191 Transcript_7836/m.14191 type:complete len:248 (-) Transcript_7836:767-1510(-)